MEQWELSARECIRDSIARYTWAGDAGQFEALASVFCIDGTLEIRGFAPLSGRSTIVDFLGGVAGGITAEPGIKPIVRHNVANVRFVGVQPERAEVSSYFTVFTHIGLDHFGRYRDIFVPVEDTWLIKHRKALTDWTAPHSVMARSG